MELSKIKSPEEIIASLKKLIKKIEHFQEVRESSLEKPLGGNLITRSKFRIIFPLVRNYDGYSIQELSNLTGVDKALVSRTVADLESKGIAVRNKEFGSKERNYKIVLSEKGRQIINEKIEKRRPAIKKLLTKITPEEISVFFKVLEKLTED